MFVVFLVCWLSVIALADSDFQIRDQTQLADQDKADFGNRFRSWCQFRRKT